MFKEDTTTGLPTKLTMQEKSAQSQSTSKISPTKRKALGKGTGGKPVRKLQTPRGMSLQTEIEQINNNAENEDDSSSTSEETTSTSPKRQNQKNTPPATATRKSTRNRQATLATEQGDPFQSAPYRSRVQPGPNNLEKITKNH